MGSIRVSKKHGVNPCLSQCFWCGKDKNEIALLGQLPGDAEAPRRAVLDYEPCAACRTQMDQGIVIMEATERPPRKGARPMSGGAYPTGSWVVITVEAAERMFTGDAGKAAIDKRKALMEVAVFRQLFGHMLPD